MKKILLSAVMALTCLSSISCARPVSSGTIPAKAVMSKETLMDKIKGGWAGQTIGCTYGGPTEFRYREKMIPDSIAIAWDEHAVHRTMIHNKHLYDDVYMDLTFVDVYDREGIDAPVEIIAKTYMDAGYSLWHANQQGRYNLRRGMSPRESGHWLHNPHADDIDFQIEADYAGLMSPGMTAAACHFADEVGHIMNYGDGWYGGVYVAAMYSLAFVCDDVETIVREALKVIPEQSRFYKAMADVIRWHGENPGDWKTCWNLIEENYNNDIGCPEGIGRPYNIDAVINSAYILVGLLYGEGDFEKTIDISTRCGQDSDCNPASAGGILATMTGYSNIPEKFLESVKEAEDDYFAYTEYSLNKTYQMSFNQALQVISRYGGKVSEDKVKIKVGKPVPVRYEKCFEGLKPGVRAALKVENHETSFEFDGCGVIVCGGIDRQKGTDFQNYVAQIEVTVDGRTSIVDLPGDYHERQEHVWHDYQLGNGHHKVTLRCINPDDRAPFKPSSYMTYIEDIHE